MLNDATYTKNMVKRKMIGMLLSMNPHRISEILQAQTFGNRKINCISYMDYIQLFIYIYIYINKFIVYIWFAKKCNLAWFNGFDFTVFFFTLVCKSCAILSFTTYEIAFAASTAESSAAALAISPCSSPSPCWSAHHTNS